jgi:hypothetical protein
MKKYRPWNLSNHDNVSHYEVPNSFDKSNYQKRYSDVNVVQVHKDGTRKPWKMNHRVLAECLGRDQYSGVGFWKKFNKPRG